MRILMLLCLLGIAALLSGCVSAVGVGPTVGNVRILGDDTIPMNANPYDYWYKDGVYYYHRVYGRPLVRVCERPYGCHVFDSPPMFLPHHYERYDRDHRFYELNHHRHDAYSEPSRDRRHHRNLRENRMDSHSTGLRQPHR